ncbi:MAG: DNA gyrase subunit A [bacterium]
MAENKKPEEQQQALIQLEPKNLGTVQNLALIDEMQRSYLDYAMSVIVSRALPDVRDGMKPVHRRILFAMWNMGLRANAKFRKSATVVGEVLGKYHPHGDLAVYETMVRMAQDFAMRYPLVNGQGNFGSIDGDGAAAHRYTEAKLTPLAEEMLLDIEKNTVDFVDNYDGTHKEPRVLPAKLPNLLLNGTVGIAVGMATNIPPHNLGELCDGIMMLLENPDTSVEELMTAVKGPDFPTGGIIYDRKEILSAYATGRGGIVMRAKTDIVETKQGGFQIIVSEIPYQVNKSTLLEKIAELVQEKKIDGIRDLRDESNKDGIRIVIDLKRDAYPKKVLNRLFQSTQLQDTFHVNTLSLVEGLQPRVLSLKEMLAEYVTHRRHVVRRRTEYDLERAKDRAHILEGLRIALLQIDKIIATIKKSADKDEARVNLMAQFKLSELQTAAILEMRLQALANLEQMRVEQEYDEKMKIIKELSAILASEKRISGIIKEEVTDLKTRFGDERRTQIMVNGLKEFSMEDVIPNEATVVMITKDNYIKRLPPDTFKTQTRGGKGVIGLETKEEDQVKELMSTNTHTDMLFFTTRGRVFQLKAYDIPVASRTSKGQAMQNFLQLSPGEAVTTTVALDAIDDAKYLVMVTRNGVIKKTELKEFAAVRRSGLIAINLKDGDSLDWVKPSTGKDEIMLVTADGQSVRFSEKNVRAMGRTATGVRAIKLRAKDRLVGMDLVDSELAAKGTLELLVISEEGLGKRTNLEEYRLQGRGGSGIKTMEVTAKTGKLVAAMVANKSDDRDVLAISGAGQVIRFSYKEARLTSRATQGVRCMRFKEAGDKVISAVLV